jgi:hypothetical protein
MQGTRRLYAGEKLFHDSHIIAEKSVISNPEVGP